MSLTRYFTEYLTNNCVNEKLDTKQGRSYLYARTQVRN